ncbi:MAG: hypothetical protein Q8K36_03450, partial [Alphaproteobacteria bacterium]|nr:hypothetical protein [Alphaproteobacteria bacterium]
MSDPLSTARTALTAASTVADVQATNMAASKTIAGKGQSFALLADRGSRETASGNGGVSGTLIKRIDEAGAAENDGNPLHVCLGRKSFFITDYGFTRVGTWKFNREGDCINHIGHKLKCFQL